MHIVAGADKFQILDYMTDAVCQLRQKKQFKPIFVIVPENRKLLLEQNLLSKAGGQLFFTEVLSIKRLAYRLFKETLACQMKAVSNELASLLVYIHVQTIKSEQASQEEANYAALSSFFHKPEYMQKLLTTEADLRRFQLNLTDIITALAKFKTAKADKLRKKLTALQDLSTAYQTALETENLTDSVGIVAALINLLKQYRQFKEKQGDSFEATLKRLSFLDNSAFYFYGFAEDNFITRQEWTLLEELSKLGVDLCLSVSLPNIAANYPKIATLRAEFEFVQANYSYYYQPNLRNLGSDKCLDFFQHLPIKAANVYQAGIRACLELLSLPALGKLECTYLIPNYDLNQAAIEAKLCDLQVPQATSEAVQKTALEATFQTSKKATCELNNGTKLAPEQAKLAKWPAPLNRQLNLKQTSDKLSIYRAILRELELNCTGPNAKNKFSDCAILFSNYAEDSAEFLSVAADFNLPIYLAEEQAQSSILSSYLDKLWQILKYGLNRETVLAFLHSPLWKNKHYDLANYENYLLSHDLNYRRLLGPFRKLTDFLAIDLAKNSLDCLMEVEAGKISEEILWPLSKLQKNLQKAKTRGERLKAILRYLQDSTLAERIYLLSQDLTNSENALLRQAGETLQAAFQKFIKHYGELLKYSYDLQHESLIDFLNSLELDFKTMEFNLLPSFGLQIWVSGAEKAAYMRFKVIYLINFAQVNDLVNQMQSGVFSLEDLELLASYEAELGKTRNALAFNNAISAFDTSSASQRQLLCFLYANLILPAEVTICQFTNEANTWPMQLASLPGVEVQNVANESLNEAKDSLNEAEASLTHKQTTTKALLSSDYLQANSELIKQLAKLDLQAKQAVKQSKTWQTLWHNYLSAYELCAVSEQMYPKRKFRLAILEFLNFAKQTCQALQEVSVPENQVTPEPTPETTTDVMPETKENATTEALTEAMTDASNNIETEWQLGSEINLLRMKQSEKQLDFALLKRLLANRYTFSINQLETYRQNPFVFFCRYLLGLQEANSISKSARNYGILLHAFAELAVKTFYLTSYKLSEQAIDIDHLNELAQTLDISALQAYLQTSLKEPFTATLPLSKTNDMTAKIAKIYQALTAPYLYDYQPSISLLEFMKQTESERVEQASLNNLAASLETLKAKQATKRMFVQQIWQNLEKTRGEKLDLNSLVYQEVLYPQLIDQALYSLKNILGQTRQDAEYTLPTYLEKRFELPLADSNLIASLSADLAQTANSDKATILDKMEISDKVAICKAAQLLGKIDRVDTAFDSNFQATDFAVIDYKTGSTKFDYERLLAGFDLQMPLYTALVNNKLKVSQASYLYLKNLYVNKSKSGLASKALDLGPNFFALSRNAHELIAKLEVCKEDKASDKFKLTSSDFVRNSQLLNDLADYSLHLSQASLVDILAAKFPYLPILGADGTGNLPFQCLAKYDLASGAYRYMASERANSKGKKNSALTKLEAALQAWQSRLNQEANLDE